MGVIIFLAIVAITVAGGFLGAFIWATQDGQFDDTYTPSVRILFDNPQEEKLEINKKDV
ncbi:cbb3-type cytochrome oxidase assembly protein CcoS [Emticicia sp.]|uniref:cbb3-type cytochrome oxidase assembly protein CcoS n=1 Tax=Emticicia sp. TaxID=1930953 RepID=UPI00375090D1